MFPQSEVECYSPEPFLLIMVIYISDHVPTCALKEFQSSGQRSNLCPLCHNLYQFVHGHWLLVVDFLVNEFLERPMSQIRVRYCSNRDDLAGIK